MLIWLSVLFVALGEGVLIPIQPMDCDQVIVCNNQLTRCPKGMVLTEKGGYGGCCHGCVRYRQYLEGCSQEDTFYFNDDTGETESKNCHPGTLEMQYADLECREDRQCRGVKCCVPRVTDCLKELEKYNNRRPDQLWKWKPDCDKDGNWAAVQCKGDDEFGRCFCTAENGDRLFGHSWKKESKQMKCECSRKQAQLEKIKKEFDEKLQCDDESTEHYIEDFTYLCDKKGNFNCFQCLNGTCFCVDRYTGKPNGAVVPTPLAWTLPCFDNSSMGDPLSDTAGCLSTNYRLHRIKKEYCLRGTLISMLPLKKCDPDNSFQAVQCDKNDCICMKQDGKTRINVYASSASKEAEMNCDCARAEAEYADLGYSNSAKCHSNGNYNQLVCSATLCHCLDSDGFQNTDEIPKDKKCCLPCRDVDPCTDGCPSLE